MFLFQTAFAELKQLYTEAKDNHYPDNALFKNVQRAVKDAEKYSCLGKLGRIITLTSDNVTPPIAASWSQGAL